MIDASNIILTFPIGNSGTDPELRNVGWEGELRPPTARAALDAMYGWPKFARGPMLRAVQQCRAQRLELHNPHGTGPDEAMLSSQMLLAKAAGLDWLVDRYAESLEFLVSLGIEIIEYRGSPMLDPEWLSLAENSSPALERFAVKCYEPALRAGLSLGFDALHNCTTAANLRIVATCNMLAEATRRVTPAARRYCETYPHRNDLPWISAGPWHVIVPSENAVAGLDELARERAFRDWALSPEHLEGREVVVFLNSLTGMPPDWNWRNFPSWIGSWCRTQFNRGYSVAVGATSMFDHNLTVEDLLP